MVQVSNLDIQKVAITSQPLSRSTWRLVLEWVFRLSLDFYHRGLHTHTAVARYPCASWAFLLPGAVEIVVGARWQAKNDVKCHRLCRSVTTTWLHSGPSSTQQQSIVTQTILAYIHGLSMFGTPVKPQRTMKTTSSTLLQFSCTNKTVDNSSDKITRVNLSNLFKFIQ